MVNEGLSWALAGVAGAALGAIFFGGLWWTVRKGVASQQPGLWFLGSLLLRMSLVLAGFYVVVGHHAERALACALGFALARWAMVRLTGYPSKENRTHAAQKDRHAY